MPPRKRVKRGDVEAECDATAASSTITPGPSATTRRSGADTNGKKRTRKTGKLAQLMEMPIEIFTEVACYMSPEDLLNLARTSIGLRELLMSKSSQRVWEAARTLQEIPPCPSDLSEPQYADLLFGKGCSFCPETRTRKTFAALRVRACKTCIEEKLVCADELCRKRNFRMPGSVAISTVITFIDLKIARYHVIRKFITSHLEELFDRIKEYASDADQLRAFIDERQKSTQLIKDSARQIESWMNGAAQQKEQTNAELINSRRASIEKRLRDLGYDDDDLNTRFDEKGWKWKHLMNQTRTLSERVWQNIRPQLEEIIGLRRVKSGPKFLSIRRDERLNEAKTRFSKYRGQLHDIPFGSLLAFGDFLEVSIVKELMEENKYRIPMREERWLRIPPRLPEAASALAKVIESDCVKRIHAAFEASQTSTQQDVNMGDQDYIPSCLLSATSLLKRVSYPSKLISYIELLQERSTTTYYGNREDYGAWSKERYELSTASISMASRLLRYLQLPKETTMAYMLAIGSDFQCLTCSRTSGVWSLTWVELVGHFISKNEQFERWSLTLKERNLDVPLRNDHDLSNPSVGKKIISRAPRTTVDLSPVSEIADRYSVLSTSWGKSLCYDSVLCSVPNRLDDEPDDESTTKESSGYQQCPLCEKFIDYGHSEWSIRDMRQHMKTRHGTDLEGNPLIEEPEDTLN